MLKNGKGRITAAVALLAFLGVGVGAYVLSGNNDEEEINTEQTESNVSLDVKQVVQTVPGASKDLEYNKLQEEVNKENYEKAKEAGEAYIPTLTNTEVVEEKFVEPEPAPQPEPEPEPTPEPTPQPEPEPIKEEIQPVVEFKEPVVKEVVKHVPVIIKQEKEKLDVDLEQLYLKDLEILKAKMEDQNSTAERTTQNFERNYLGLQLADKQNVSNTQSFENSSSFVGNENNSIKTDQGAAFVRAGTIIPGMVLTAVNTDEPGPVLAEIVAGPEELKGARLIGEVVNAPTDVTSRVQKATIQFTRLEMKGAKQGFAVNVFAVDPNTMNTGVASKVDNHYFLRYGVGLAAKFVEGLGSAFADSGKTVSYTEQATIVSVSGKTKDHMKKAIGGVGQKLGNEISRMTDVPATIYVDSGHPIGLLFMSDF